ncbi:MAG: trehalose-binding protein [Clostridiales bacterium]|nr:trehalose-binding protein [Clostridiales bacterium]
MDICGLSFEEYIEKIEKFHGAIAPGLVLGGFMVSIAKEYFEDERSFYSYAESGQCLPDALQLLTPCTWGNSRLKVLDLGRYAIVLYDKNEGNGIRVFVDTKALDKWKNIKEWYFKLVPKDKQDLDALLSEMKQAGRELYGIQKIKVDSKYLGKKKMGPTGVCPLCGEAYPLSHGSICRGCREPLPYNLTEQTGTQVYDATNNFGLRKTPVENAIGKHLLHDITRVIPQKEKGVAFSRGHLIRTEDVLEMKKIGKFNLYTQEDNLHMEGFRHEEEAALAFASKMAGSGVVFSEKAVEGKADLIAAADGLLVIDENRLKRFNMNKGVICAAKYPYTLVKKGDTLAGTRIIPLYISGEDFVRASAALDQGPIFKVAELRKAKVGILVTGTEVFEGLVEEKYSAIMTDKVEKLGCKVVSVKLSPDSPDTIAEGIKALISEGADLVICTSGMSVDPDDVTVEGIIKAGAQNVRYGLPVLPGSMLLIGDIGNVQVIGAPACGLFKEHFSIDLVLPRMLAGLEVTDEDLAALGSGGMLKGKCC